MKHNVDTIITKLITAILPQSSTSTLSVAMTKRSLSDKMIFVLKGRSFCTRFTRFLSFLAKINSILKTMPNAGTDINYKQTIFIIVKA